MAPASGRVAAITGGTRGIGRATAAALARRGARMVTPEEAAEAIADVVEKPRPEIFVPRSLGVVLRAYQAAPPRLRDLVERVLRLDEAYGGVDPRSREQYEASLG